MNKKFVIGLVIILIILGFGASLLQSTKNDQEITVGAVLSLTGMASVDGQNIKRGIDFAQEDLAKQGIKVKVVYEDDGTEPKKTVSAIQKLVATDKPIALIGPTWSFLADAGAPVIDSNKIFTISPANTSEFVSTNSKYFFFGAPKNEDKEKPTENWLRENNIKRVAIVYEQSAWGDSHVPPFTKAVEKVGGEVVFVDKIAFDSDAVTIQNIISKAIAQKVDAVLYTGFDKSTTILIEKKQDLGANFKLLAATEIPKGLVKNGIISVSPNDNIWLLVPGSNEEFSKKFEKRYGEAPGSYVDRGYDALMLIVDALKNKPVNQSADEFLRSGYVYKGFAGEYKFDEHNDVIGGKWIVERL